MSYRSFRRDSSSVRPAENAIVVHEVLAFAVAGPGESSIGGCSCLQHHNATMQAGLDLWDISRGRHTENGHRCRATQEGYRSW